jgi:hypothetical protein
VTPVPFDVPVVIVDALRAICLALPGAVEEQAWIGTRWRVRQRTFAHVVAIDAGWPPAYVRAAGTDGPAVVLTFESSGDELEALTRVGHPFFKPPWRATVIGMLLDADADWDEVDELITESHRMQAAPRQRRG